MRALFPLLLILPSILAAESVLAQQTGEQIFSTHCIRCHVPVEIERLVRRDWAGRSADQLFESMTQTMPAEAPGSLAESEYLGELPSLQPYALERKETHQSHRITGLHEQRQSQAKFGI